MSHPNYRRATNAAYDLLRRLPTFTLSTNVFFIIENMLDSCKLLTYGQACFLYGYSRYQLIELSEFGFSIKRGSQRIILYNEKNSLGCIRFTLAHEIGHAVLGHSDGENPTFEREANCFARNLLCPIPIVGGLVIDGPADYVAIFNVTEQMAENAIKNIPSDKYYISENNHDALSEMLDAYMMGFESLDAYHYYLAS